MSNNCIILAAGLGSRLEPLTKQTPKCCLQFINGETIIQRLVRQIFNFTNIDNITICVGFHSEKIINALSSYNNRISFVYNPIYNETNNMYSSLLGIETISNSNSLTIVNADCVYSDDILEMVSDATESVIPFDKEFWDSESVKIEFSQFMNL